MASSKQILELGTGYSMSKWVEQHQESTLSIKLAKNVLIQKGLQESILCCIVKQYDPQAVLEFWQNMQNSNVDEHAVKSRVKGKSIRVNQALLTEVFGFKTFGPENNGDPSHTDDQRLRQIRKMLLNAKDPKNPPRAGMKNTLYKKEYAELGGYFARALWGFTSGNDEMSMRKVDMVMIVDRQENFDWGKYLVSLFKFYKSAKKLPLVYQVQKILDAVKVQGMKMIDIPATRFKKESTVPSVLAHLARPIIIELRKQTKISIIESMKEDAADATGNGDDDGERGEESDQGSSENEAETEEESVAEETESSSSEPNPSVPSTSQTTSADQSLEQAEDDEVLSSFLKRRTPVKSKVQTPGTLIDEQDDDETDTTNEATNREPAKQTAERGTTQAFGFTKFLLEKATTDAEFDASIALAQLKKRKFTSEKSLGAQNVEKEATEQPLKRSKRVKRMSSKLKDISDILPEAQMYKNIEQEAAQETVATEEVIVEEMEAEEDWKLFFKNARRRIAELLSYKLQHRSFIPHKSMLEFEDWVMDQGHSKLPSFEHLVDVPQNKLHIKTMALRMVEKAKTDKKAKKMFTPELRYEELTDSDEEWDKLNSTTPTQTEPRTSAPNPSGPSTSGQNPSVVDSSVSEEKLDEVLDRLQKLKELVIAATVETSTENRTTHEKTDEILSKLDGIEAKVSEGRKQPTETTADEDQLTKLASRIAGNVARQIRVLGKELKSSQAKMENEVSTLANEYQLSSLLMHNFVADANKGEKNIVNSPAAREAVRRNLAMHRLTEENKLRQAEEGRLMLTDELKTEFLILSQRDPTRWEKYKAMDYLKGLKQYLKDLHQG